jgi:hypothetical protein
MDNICKHIIITIIGYKDEHKNMIKKYKTKLLDFVNKHKLLQTLYIKYKKNYCYAGERFNRLPV